LSSIRVPTAILVGEEDYATPPAMAQVLHEGIAGSTFEVIPGARHITPLQVPDVIANALESLIGRERR
jgi:3-oxoadipate enol-lactonase